MTHFEESTKFFVYTNRPQQGWRLANGNLDNEPAALVVAEELRALGQEVRVTRQDVTILLDS